MSNPTTLGDLISTLRQTPIANGKSGDALTTQDFPALARAIVPFVKEAIAEAVAPLEQRIDALESKRGLAPLSARLAGLEASQLTDGGVWEEGKTYRRSQVVQDHGAVWVCTVPDTTSRPPSEEWRLWVRREGRRDRK